MELDSTIPLNHPMSHPVKTELTYNPRRNYGFSPQWYSRPNQDLHSPGLVLNHRNQLKTVHVSQTADRKHSHSAENRDSSLFQESDKLSSRENLFSKKGLSRNWKSFWQRTLHKYMCESKWVYRPFDYYWIEPKNVLKCVYTIKKFPICQQ